VFHEGRERLEAAILGGPWRDTPEQRDAAAKYLEELRKGVTNGTVDEDWIKDRYEKVTGFKWPTAMDPGGLPPGPGEVPTPHPTPPKPGPGDPPDLVPMPGPGVPGGEGNKPDLGPKPGPTTPEGGGGQDFKAPPSTSAGEGRSWVFHKGDYGGGGWQSVDDSWKPPGNIPGQSYTTADGKPWEPTKGTIISKRKVRPDRPDRDDKSEYGGIRKMGADNRPTPKKPRHIV